MYTVVLRRWIEDEGRNSYSAIFHSLDINEAKEAAKSYAYAERGDIIMVVSTEHVTEPEDRSMYVFVAEDDEIIQADTYVADHSDGMVNIMQNWEDDYLSMMSRIDICYDYMEEKQFLRMIAGIIKPFVDLVSKNRLGCIISYRRLLEYIDGVASVQDLVSARNYAYDCYNVDVEPLRRIDLVVYRAIGFAVGDYSAYGLHLSIVNACKSYVIKNTLSEDILREYPLRELLLAITKNKPRRRSCEQ